jgi:hypothetical protein
VNAYLIFSVICKYHKNGTILMFMYKSKVIYLICFYGVPFSCSGWGSAAVT